MQIFCYLLPASLVLHLACGVSSRTCHRWVAQRDDPSEYTQLASIHTSDATECVIRAASVGASAATHANATCSLLTCRLGQFGCRKCRNARNSELPLFWMKQLNGTNFCWRTFQHRVDASVSFSRDWSEYVNGFGDGENANFWIGLEALHQMTEASPRRVRWEFSDWHDTWNWTENPNFTVADASDMYRASMGEVDLSRSTVDQFPIDNNFSPNCKMFSTIDVDNDISDSHSCARDAEAGWWFGSCTFLNPNGKYYEPPDALNTLGIGISGLFYLPPDLSPEVFWPSSGYSMKTFECLISDQL